MSRNPLTIAAVIVNVIAMATTTAHATATALATTTCGIGTDG